MTNEKYFLTMSQQSQRSQVQNTWQEDDEIQKLYTHTLITLILLHTSPLTLKHELQHYK